jgi:Ca2+-binding RTX toxin-like protein
MVALVNVGVMGTPSNGHNLEPANVAGSIVYVAGATPEAEAGTIGPVHVGRDGIGPGSQLGSHGPFSGNAILIHSLNDLYAGIIDGFSVSWTFNDTTETRTLGPEAFVGVSTLAELAAVIDSIDGSGPGTGLACRIDFNGDFQITAPFLRTLTAVMFTTSTGLTAENTTVDITGVTDAEADNVDTFTITINGVPLDTSSLDLSAVTSRAELAAALDALPGIQVTESADNGGTITITAETPGPKTFTDISLADVTANPAMVSFGASSLAALDQLVAAAESFSLNLNGAALDLSSLDFAQIDTAAQLAAALDAVPGISATLTGSTITIVSNALGAGNAFSGLALTDNEGSPAAHATVVVTDVDATAADAVAFTLSLDGVPVDLSPVDFSAVTDGASLAAQLDRIAGIDVSYSAANGGTLTITASTIGPAVFSDVSLVRYNIIRGTDAGEFIFAGNAWAMGFGGDDTLFGSGSDDRLDGGEGNDTLTGNSGFDVLNGEGGNDTIHAGYHDTVDGGDGDDRIYLLDAEPASLAGGAGDDTVLLLFSLMAPIPEGSGIERYEIAGHQVHADFSEFSIAVTVTFGAFFDSSVTGSRYDDRIFGGSGNDTAYGGSGNDTFSPGGDIDVFDGGDDTDTLVLNGSRQQFRVDLLGNGDIAVTDLRVSGAVTTVRAVEKFAFTDGTIDAASVLNDPPVGAVIVNGTAIEDQVLGADASSLTDQDGIGTLHYQWQRDSGHGFADVGADQATYALGDADVGASIRVVVRYTDLNGNAEEVASAATAAIANINDAPAIAFLGGGDASLTLEENSVAIAVITAEDPDSSLTYAIAGGADAAAFHIDAISGTLSFVDPPDFEHPADADHDNVYVVQVRVSDGSLFDEQSITVTITDANEVLTGTPGDDNFTELAGIERIDAGGGIDTITFDFALTEATVTFSGSRVTVDSASSHIVLTGFERFVFTDGIVNNADGDVLVDDLFYYAQNHDVWNAHVDADSHYHATGWREGRDPSAFFSTGFYRALNADVAAAGIDPLAHWHAAGWQEGRLPSLAFDAAKYLAANPDVAAAHIDPLLHFLLLGAGEGRQPIAATSQVSANGFDAVYYYQQNPDVVAAGVDLYWHFQTIGWKEGRNPNAYFDVNGYLASYADVKAAGINPLDHYNVAGWHEGRDPSVAFDTTAYLAANPDVKAAHLNPLAHFLVAGAEEGRSAQADGVWG